MFFTDLGRVYRLKCYEVPEGARTSKGMNIANLLPISQDERVTSMIRVPEFDEDRYLVMVTRNGVIKRTPLSAFQTTRKGGVIAIDLDEGRRTQLGTSDRRQRRPPGCNQEGYGNPFQRRSDVRAMGRAARGVKALTLRQGDCVVGMRRCA